MDSIHFFAGFIITYQRSDILLDTIQKIYDQTFPPEKLWIIDNSEDFATKQKIEELNNTKLIYYRVGHNAGPAGAACVGLKLVAEAGYKWILWGDDDDPPPYKNSFEKIFNLLTGDVGNLKIGQMGLVGQRFDSKKGKVIRISDAELKSHPWIEVDTIAGGQMKIVSSDVVKKGVLPAPDLFYGYEELGFDLSLKKAGFSSLVSTTEFLEVRIKYDRIDFERPVYSKKTTNRLWREYYSTRNLLTILKRNKLYVGYLYFLLKSIAKSLYGFSYGGDFGRLNFIMINKGVFHSILNKTGKQV